MGWFSWFEKKPKEEWRLVKTIKYDSGISKGKKDTDSYQRGELYYHLFESDQGNRCMQVKTTIQDIDQNELNKFAISTKFYHEKLYRWLLGRGDPDINRFDEVDQEEMVHQLKGTIKESITVTE